MPIRKGRDPAGTMGEFINTLLEYVHDNWIKALTGAFIMAVGWFFGRRKAQADWKKKEFLDRLNVSLTSILNGRLLIRTVLEKRCDEVFLNSVAAENVVHQARNTTPDDPLLPLPKDDYWFYLNSVLNEIAEKFSIGQVQRDAGLPVRSFNYLMCLTCECDGPVRTRKIRAMLVRKDTLLNLPEKQPALERAHHITRWKTLQCLAKAHTETPHRFLEVEICL